MFASYILIGTKWEGCNYLAIYAPLCGIYEE